MRGGRLHFHSYKGLLANARFDLPMKHNPALLSKVRENKYDVFCIRIA
jgi:hypothetical protein